MATSNPEPLKQVSNGAAAKGGDETYQLLRHTGGRAWQLHASLRAADHFIAQDAAADRNTGSWLVAGAVDLAEEVASELDGLARTLKDRPSDPSLPNPLQKLRSRSHKLHAAARAADHYFDQDTSEDRVTASWLVANALELASRLAAEIDDEASQLKRGGGSSAAAAEAPAAFTDAVSGRKAPGNLRGAVSG